MRITQTASAYQQKAGTIIKVVEESHNDRDRRHSGRGNGKGRGRGKQPREAARFEYLLTAARVQHSLWKEMFAQF